ncbi:hypothetical protein D3C73_553090 [compost metagenome]
MSEVVASQVLLERLISTNGFSVRESSQDDAFWYTSGKPGPFYINTENIAGEYAIDGVLENITNILKNDLPRELQTKTILELINQLIENDHSYNNAMEALLDYYLSHSTYRPTIISGGERRDWFFSIPIAKKLKIPHIFLFKSGDYLVIDPKGAPIELVLSEQRVLHVADIINLASSYLNRWIPILKNVGAEFTETLSVAVRNHAGIANLQNNHISVVSPLIVDRPLFNEAFNLGLINKFAYDEIIHFYDSPNDWTRSFLSQSKIADDNQLDAVTKERIKSFKNSDPYQLKSEFPWFFS